MRISETFLASALAIAGLLAIGSMQAVRAQAPPPAPAAQPAPTPGTAEAGRVIWSTPTRARCRDCHGMNGEGGFGPDLAGRGLSVEQFRRAVRQPWGVMPAYTERQLREEDLTAMALYMASLPKVATPGPWHVTVPPNASAAQTLMISIGCGQCHEADMGLARMFAGGEGADYDWWVKRVYTHTEFYATGMMGNYSPIRVPESTIREIWKFASEELGLRALVRTNVAAGAAAGGNSTYTVTVSNMGMAGKGLTAENLTVSINVPAGASVGQTTGDRYQGVRRNDQGAQVAEWTVPRLAAGEKAVYTIALSGSAAAPRGEVHWTKPTMDMAPIGGPQGPGGGPPPPQP